MIRKSRLELNSSIFDKFADEFGEDFAYEEYERRKYSNIHTHFGRYVRSFFVLFLYSLFTYMPAAWVFTMYDDGFVISIAGIFLFECILIGLGISMSFIKFPSYISSFHPTDVEVFRGMRLDMKSGYHYKKSISIIGCVVTIATGWLFAGLMWVINAVLAGVFIPYIGETINSFLGLLILLLAFGPILLAMSAAGIDFSSSSGRRSNNQATVAGMILGQQLFKRSRRRR